MRKGMKGWMLAALALILVGCGLMGASWRRVVAQEESAYTQKEFACAADAVTAIAVDGFVGEVSIFPVEGDEVILHWYDGEQQKWNVRLEDGVLKADCMDEKNWVFQIGVRLSDKNFDCLSIGLPEGIAPEGMLKATTGKISCQGVRFSALTAECSTGGIALENVDVSGEVRLKATTGAIQLADVRAGDMEAIASTGSVKLRSVSAGELTVKLTTGLVQLEDVTARKIGATASTGDIRMEHVSADAFELRTTTGDIDGSISQAMKEFTIDSDTATGDNNLPKHMASGEKTLFASTLTGSIHILFAE